MADTSVLAELMDEIDQEIYTEFSPTLPEAARTAMIGFAAHTHCTNGQLGGLVADSTPLLAIIGDEPDSGKTTMLEITRLLAHRGHLVSARNTTAPGIIRAIQETKASLFLDQIENMISHNGRGFSDRIDILETGRYRIGETLNADGFHPTFAPIAISGLQSMFLGNPNLAALRTRAIMIHMDPIPPDVDYTEYEAFFHQGLVEKYGRALDVAVRQVLEDIKVCRPVMEGLRLRMRQIWRPLFQVAEVAGGVWPARMRLACRELSMGIQGARAFLSPQDQLLLDIEFVASETVGSLSNARIAADIIEAGLQSAQYWASPAQGERAVTRAMRSREVEPQSIWNKRLQQARQGYKRADLEKAFPSLRTSLIAEENHTAESTEEEAPNGDRSDG